jgi:hypothetical protein
MKFLQITKRVIRDSRTSFITATVVALVFGTLSVLFFPTIKETGADLEKLLANMPQELIKALNITATDITDLTTTSRHVISDLSA